MKRGYILATALAALLMRFPALAAEPRAKPAALAEERALLAQYAPFGLTSEAGCLYYEGARVRYFFDGYELEEGTFAVRYEYVDAAGTVDVHTVRSVLQNEDGSVDGFGELTAISPYSEEEFARRDIGALLEPRERVACTEAEPVEDAGLKSDAATCVADGSACEADGLTLSQRFERYADYGLRFEAQSGNEGTLYYEGERVGRFIDEGPGGVFTYTSREPGGLTVRVRYDEQGRLAGLDAA